MGLVSVLMRPTKWSRRAGESIEFTCKRKKNDRRNQIAKAARKKNRRK